MIREELFAMVAGALSGTKVEKILGRTSAANIQQAKRERRKKKAE